MNINMHISIYIYIYKTPTPQHPNLTPHTRNQGVVGGVPERRLSRLVAQNYKLKFHNQHPRSYTLSLTPLVIIVV